MPVDETRTSMIYVAGKAANLLLAPLAVVVLPGMLGDAAYGRFSYWFGLISIYLIVLDGGSQPLLRRYLPELLATKPGVAVTLFRKVLVLKCWFIPVLAVIILFSGETGIALVLVAAAVFASLATTLADVYYACQKMGYHSLVILARKLIRFILVPVFFLIWGIPGILGALFTAELAGFLLAAPARKTFSYPGQPLPAGFADYYRHGIFLFLAMLAANVTGRFPVLVAEWKDLPASEIGLVALCVDLSYFTIKELVNAVSESIFPRLIRLHYLQQHEDVSALVRQNFRVVNYIAIGISGLGIGLAEPFLRLLGSDYHQMAAELRAMLGILIFANWNLIYNQQLIVRNMTIPVFLSQGAGLLAGISCLIPFSGSLDAGILCAALGVAMVCACGISFFFAPSKLLVADEVIYFIKPLAISLLLGLALLSLDIDGVGPFILAGSAGMLLYTGLTLAAGGVHKDDLVLVRNMFPPRA